VAITTIKIPLLDLSATSDEPRSDERFETDRFADRHSDRTTTQHYEARNVTMAKTKKLNDTTSASVDVRTITIENVGPVEKVAIPIPEEGGVVVLRGRNGRGKTTTLDAIETALTGRGRVAVRDGALRGAVDAFGVTITAARNNTRRGELEVHSLDGRLDIATLVDPGIKSPEAADALRIKALVALTGAKADATLFHDLAGGEEYFAGVVKPASTSGDDLVVMAERIKRDFESAARDHEAKAAGARTQAAALSKTPDGLDLTAECDVQKLSDRQSQAIARAAALRASLQAHEEAADAVQAANEELSAANASSIEAEITQAQHELERDRGIANQTRAEITEAERVLAELRSRLIREDDQAQRSQDRLNDLHEEAERIERYKAAAARAIPRRPSDEALQEAEAEVTAAREAIERGALIRNERRRLADAESHVTKATLHDSQAAKLREAAAGVDEVLSGVVARAGVALRVQAGRLVLDTRRGETYFDDLSHGERWKLALEIAIKAVGRGGVLVIPQEAWESLDPVNRQVIAETLSGSGVVLITAEASSDEDITASAFVAEAA